MTIDPMAAVTTATDLAGSAAAGADPAVSSASSNAHQNTQQVRVAGEGTSVDLSDYTAQQQNRPPAIETLQPESQAKYLSNPQLLGEKVLERLEGLHQRSLDYRNELSGAGTASQAPAPTGQGSDVMAGPASGHVAGSANANGNDGLGYLNVMFDYALETTMISSSSAQFVSGVNTLMKGQ